jgi:hypothetical protein
VLCGLALASSACGGDSADVAPHVQAGTVTLTTGVGVPDATVGFVFRPDGASEVQSGSATGTRAII